MGMAQELPSGIHLAFPNSKMTELDTGVFIPYDCMWGKRMDKLKEFLSTCYGANPEEFPRLFADHIHVEEILRQHQNQCEKPSVTLKDR